MDIVLLLKRFAIILFLIVLIALSFVVEDNTGWGSGEIGGIFGGFDLPRFFLFIFTISLIAYWPVKGFIDYKNKK